MFALVITSIPVAAGIAMLRYRLYEIDVMISKTLVYGSFSVILGAAYVGLVLAGQWVFSSFAGGSNLAIAASTLVVAALFLPVRSRVQRFVDRRFYRRRYDAQRTLEALRRPAARTGRPRHARARPPRRRRRDDAARACVGVAADGGAIVRALAWTLFGAALLAPICVALGIAGDAAVSSCRRAAARCSRRR